MAGWRLSRFVKAVSSGAAVHGPSPGQKRAAIAIVLRLRPPHKQCSSVDELVGLCDAGEDTTELLFMLRASNDTDKWSGHVACPGGRLEDGETDHAAAVREVREEVGLELDSKEYAFVGRLDDKRASSGKDKLWKRLQKLKAGGGGGGGDHPPLSGPRPSGLDVAVLVFVKLGGGEPRFLLDPAEAQGVLWAPVSCLRHDCLQWDAATAQLPRFVPVLKTLVPSKAAREFLGLQTVNCPSVPLHDFAARVDAEFGPSRRGAQPPPPSSTPPPFNLWGLTLTIMDTVARKGSPRSAIPAASLHWPPLHFRGPAGFVLNPLTAAALGVVDIATGFRRGFHWRHMAGVAALGGAVRWLFL